MTTEPNTPASGGEAIADIAREADLSEIEYLITQATNASFDCGEYPVAGEGYGDLVNKSCGSRQTLMEAIKSAIDKAIARDRAEREAELAECRNMLSQMSDAVGYCKGMDAGNELPRWHGLFRSMLDETHRRNERMNKAEAKLAEREAELTEAIEWKERYQRTAHINARDADALAGKLAEQSAALVAAKDFVANVKAHKVSGWGDCEPQFDASFKQLDHALTQIEALAGKEAKES